MDLNKAAKRAYTNAINRKKISKSGGHQESVNSLKEEFEEFERANEDTPGDHMPNVSEAVEELTDILIGAMTELYRRDIDIEKVVHEKLKYNESRISK